MKSTVKRAIRDEKGYVLITVLVLLVVGGLILTPLLGLMSTGLLAGRVYEKKTDELYAADAGWEDAIWRIQTNNLTFAANNWSEPWHLIVNGKNVTAQVYREDLDPECGGNSSHRISYHILSTAATDDGGGTAAIGSSTTVESYVEVTPGIELNFLGGALVSRTDIMLVKNLNVYGDVYYCGDKEEGDHVEIYGTVHDDICPVPFPTPEEDEELAQALKDRAMAGEIIDGDVVIPDEGSANWGPTYIAGNLTIGRAATITLGGILYVEGWINWRDDCEHGSKAITITGTGSIVAGGDICFGNLADYTLTSDSIIMSLNGDIVLEKEEEGDELHALIYAPNGHIWIGKHFTVYGQVVGNSIEVQESSYTYVPIDGSDFFDSLTGGLDIKTYNVS